jgi:hypothetical protein
MKKTRMTKRQQFWLEHVHAAMRSGQPLQQYAKRHELSIGALYNAKSVFKRDGLLKSAATQAAPSAFVPVQVAPQTQALIRCRLQHVSGWQLDLERLPDAKWLRELIDGRRDAAT